MPSFGEQLRREREIRNTAVEDIASTTQIDRGYLEALERNEFDSLPGRAFGKFYIRAYAEVLGFDPQPLIAAYDLEQQNQAYEESARELDELTRAEIEEPVEASDAATDETVAEPLEAAERSPDEAVAEPLEAVVIADDEAFAEPCDAADTTHDAIVEPNEPPTAPQVEEPIPVRIEASPELEPVTANPAELLPAEVAPFAESTPSGAAESTGSRTAALAVVLLAIVLLVGAALVNYFFLGSSRLDSASKGEIIDKPSRPAVMNAPVPDAVETVTAGEPATETARDPIPEIRQTPPPAAPAIAAPTKASDLNVTDYGVGRRVVNRRLEGRADSFREGQTVSFATRVLGGESGEVIRHVWLHEGKVKQSIELKLGGAHWRTHSRKRLWGVGPWQVEARDMDGRVLATATFVCLPASS